MASGNPEPRRWLRPAAAAFWLLFIAVNVVLNSVDAQIAHPTLRAWMPWSWECSSGVLIVALLPAVIVFERRWPIGRDDWPIRLSLHAVASVAFSLIHVGGMVGLRKLVYATAGFHYDFGPWWIHFGYEYLKDARTYAFIVAVLMLYRRWRLRREGEARLLAVPDEDPPRAPMEHPERFLVRKLGKEFLVNAREVEWLQAAGNYVNLHMRGLDYPLRSTMAAIEARLDPARFVRVHRGYIVNLDYLAQIEPLETGDARLHLRDGAKVPCSRSYRTPLRERFGQPIKAE